MVEPTDMVRNLRVVEPRLLFHVDLFPEIVNEEGIADVQVVELPVPSGSDG